MDYFKITVLVISCIQLGSHAIDPPEITIVGKPKGTKEPTTGDTVIIKCKDFVANGATKSLSATANLITLLPNDPSQQPLTGTGRYSKVADKMSEIKITGIQPSDGGYYACASMTTFTVSNVLELVVKDRPMIELKGVRQGQVMKVKEMEELPVDCEASGKYKNTKLTVKIGERDILSDLKQSQSFSWNPTSPSGTTQMNPRWTGSARGRVVVGVNDHMKKVECKASVGSPQLDKAFSFTLSVEANPRKMNCTVDQSSVQVGDKVTYTCLIASEPKPESVKWSYLLNDVTYNLTSPGKDSKKILTAEQTKVDSGKHIKATLLVDYKFSYQLKYENITLKVVNSFGPVEYVFPSLVIRGRSTGGASTMCLSISLATSLLVLINYVFYKR